MRIDSIQQRVADYVEQAISENINIPLRMGTVSVRHLDKIEIEDVLLEDLTGDTLAYIDKLTAHISTLHLLQSKIKINTIILARPEIRITRPTPEAETNIGFIMDLLAGNNTASAGTIPDIRANQIQIYDGKFNYDVLSASHNKEAFSPEHIQLYDIQSSISLKRLDSDSISLNIRRISAKEKSGIEFKRLKANINASKRLCKVEHFCLQMDESEIKADKAMALYRVTEENGLDDLKFEGEIYSNNIDFADIKALHPVFTNDLPNLRFRMQCNGNDERINISALQLSTPDKGIELHGSGSCNPAISKNIFDIDINSFYIEQKKTELLYSLLPQAVREWDVAGKFGDIEGMGNARLNGKEFDCNINISTNCGTVSARSVMTEEGNYDIELTAESIDIGTLTGDGEFGSCNIYSTGNGIYKSTNEISGRFNSIVTALNFKGYEYDIIEIENKIESDRLKTIAKCSDKNLIAHIDFEYIPDEKLPQYIIKADIDTLCLNALNIIEKNEDEKISFELNAKFQGNNIDRAVFNADIYNFCLQKQNKNMEIDHFHIRDNTLTDKRHLIIDSDILNGYLMGYYNYSTLPHSLYRLVGKYLPSASSAEQIHKNPNNSFVFRLDFGKSEIFSEMLDLPFTIHQDSYLEGNYDDKYSRLDINGEMNKIDIAGNLFRHIKITGNSDDDKITCHTEFISPASSEEEMYEITDNDLTINLTSEVGNDTLKNTFEWKNKKAPINRGNMRFDITIHRNSDKNMDFTASMLPGMIIYRDDIWTLSQSKIYSKENKYHIENFVLQDKNRILQIDGTIGNSENDSLHIKLKDINIEDILDATTISDLEFAGVATGDIDLAKISDGLQLNSRLRINDFKFKRGYFGDMDFSGRWNNELQSILLQAHIHNPSGIGTKIDGFVSPANDTINLYINADNTNLDFLNHLLPSILADVEGGVNGNIRICGSLKKINLYGDIVPLGRLRLRPTNTVYTLAGDTLHLEYNKFTFDNFGIRDLYNNKGTINGTVNHNCLKDFTCHFNIKADNILAYHSPDFGGESFYGTAFATGNVDINVDEQGTFLHAEVRPEKNSKFVYNAGGPSGVSSNKFITFVERSKKVKEKSIIINNPNVIENINSNLRLDFIIDMNPDMLVRVYTNTTTDDYIDIYGNGRVNAVYDEKKSFTMQGNMNITRGTYKFTLQEIFPKEFTIRPGSTLEFNGDPFAANLNLKTVYTVPSAPLTDLTINADRRKSVKVDCLMDITGTLNKPNLNFALELPDSNEEERELLASATSTPEQTNMQFIYLLGIGKFYTYDYNNQENDNQSSTVMESLISSTISGQLNNMLSQITDNDNWNISGNFTSSERGWNSMEVEGILQGRLLDNRLLINGNFGYRDNPIANKNFIGDFEVQWLLNKNGNIVLKAYNKTNDRYFSKTTLTTQGAGILLRHDFNGWRFWRKDNE
ncbi:MAG: translocation/assembly module TamB [Bacteroidaceae bacterium]|nr:translocation/assembly module TamB [Bacteroidaceae bacterium]